MLDKDKDFITLLVGASAAAVAVLSVGGYMFLRRKIIKPLRYRVRELEAQQYEDYADEDNDEDYYEKLFEDFDDDANDDDLFENLFDEPYEPYEYYKLKPTKKVSDER